MKPQKNTPVPAISSADSPATGTPRKAAKILERGFRFLLRHLATGEPFRLTAAMRAVLRAATPDSALSAAGATQLLLGFEFARNGALNSNLLAPITGCVNPNDGTLQRVAAPFRPLVLTAAAGTTHVMMASIAAELDWEQGQLRLLHQMSAIVPWTGPDTTVLEHCHTVHPDSLKPVYLALGLLWYRERHGVMVAQQRGTFHPLVVVDTAGHILTSHGNES